MKQWEQIAFAIALAAFGWLLFQGSKGHAPKPPTTAFDGTKVPLWMTLGTINLPFALASDYASFVPLSPDSAGQEDTFSGLQPTTPYPTS